MVTCHGNAITKSIYHQQGIQSVQECLQLIIRRLHCRSTITDAQIMCVNNNGITRIDTLAISRSAPPHPPPSACCIPFQFVFCFLFPIDADCNPPVLTVNAAFLIKLTFFTTCSGEGSLWKELQRSLANSYATAASSLDLKTPK